MSHSPIDDAFWKNSPEPVDSDEEDGDGGKEWNYQIVGEEVDNGRVRYEIDWDNWQRKDGTTQTWDNIHPSHLKKWKLSQARRRAEVVKDSIDIDLEAFSGTDIHNTETRLRAQAFEEKLEARRRYSPKLEEQMHKLLADKLGPGWESAVTNVSAPAPQVPTTSARGLRLSTMRQHQTQSQSPRTKLNQSLPPPAASSSSPWSPPSRSDAESGLSREDEAPRSLSKTDLKGKHPQTNLRLSVSVEWTKIAQSHGAAPILFVNDIDGEDLPPGMSKFRYLERGYIYANGIEQPGPEFHIGCDCKHCDFASKCGCQAISEVANSKGQKTFAYKSNGLFAFNTLRGVEVIECNQACRCSLSCRNRVAQRPRDIPLEIFKTQTKGWGVRASVDIVRGKVLGMYSGRLITRRSALKMNALRGGFCFDLDGQEDMTEDEGDNQTDGGKFSVDSRVCGNWTRFINHSCSPNMTIYLVAYDTIPSTNRPYIYFVARENIKCGTELTMDYDPAAADPESLLAGDSERTKECFCGSDQCRRHVRMF